MIAVIDANVDTVWEAFVEKDLSLLDGCEIVHEEDITEERYGQLADAAAALTRVEATCDVGRWLLENR